MHSTTKDTGFITQSLFRGYFLLEKNIKWQKEKVISQGNRWQRRNVIKSANNFLIKKYFTQKLKEQENEK